MINRTLTKVDIKPAWHPRQSTKNRSGNPRTKEVIMYNHEVTKGEWRVELSENKMFLVAETMI
jgi:hypothetical protein